MKRGGFRVPLVLRITEFSSATFLVIRLFRFYLPSTKFTTVGGGIRCYLANFGCEKPAEFRESRVFCRQLIFVEPWRHLRQETNIQ
jgi:hypothetical protein